MTTPLKVFVAAPYGRRLEVRKLHERMRDLGFEPVARWPMNDYEDSVVPRVARVDASRNDHDRDKAHCLLMLGYPGEGGESFAECGSSLLCRTPVCWVGRRILSTYRDGVRIAESIEEALDVLQGWSSLISRPVEADTIWARAMIWDSVITHQRAWLGAEEAISAGGAA